MIHPHVYGQVSMAANFNKHITLDFNCGYAQVAENSYQRGDGKALHTSLNEHRNLGICLTQMRSMDCSHRALKPTIKNPHNFDQECEKMVQIWSKRWNPSSTRLEYEATFAIEKWKKLSTEQKEQHTLKTCKAC